MTLSIIFLKMAQNIVEKEAGLRKKLWWQISNIKFSGIKLTANKVLQIKFSGIKLTAAMCAAYSLCTTLHCITLYL